MDFASFAISHGLCIKDFSHSDRIRRCGTVMHPSSTNGAYYFDGIKGWCQNWESSGQPHWWQSDKKLDPREQEAWQRRAEQWKEQRRELAKRAARKAQARIDEAAYGCHPYLASKGLENAYGLIEPTTQSLIVPMRHMRDNSLLGLQEIYFDYFNRKWMKKMQYGMVAKGAVWKKDAQGSMHGVYCEGFATGLSIIQALAILKLPTTVTICFSADNMLQVARYFGDVDHSIIFADNDKSGKGQEVAIASGFVWTMAEQEGWDANDLHRNEGAMAVLRHMMEAFKKRDAIYGKKHFQKRETAG